jgi:hypothetical protein
MINRLTILLKSYFSVFFFFFASYSNILKSFSNDLNLSMVNRINLTGNSNTSRQQPLAFPRNVPSRSTFHSGIQTSQQTSQFFDKFSFKTEGQTRTRNSSAGVSTDASYSSKGGSFLQRISNRFSKR